MFAQGKLAMMFATLAPCSYLRSTIKDFTWDVAPPPGDVEQKTESSVIVFCIPKKAKNPDQAWICSSTWPVKRAARPCCRVARSPRST